MNPAVRPTLAEIREAAAEAHGLTVAEITAQLRDRDRVDARQDAWAVSLAFGYGLSQIARSWERDHTTVMHVAKRRAAHEDAEPLRVAILNIAVAKAKVRVSRALERAGGSAVARVYASRENGNGA